MAGDGRFRRAAQVVPWRADPAAKGLVVYLLHRPTTLRAFPGVWAFPGGVLEESDYPVGRSVERDLFSAWFDRVERSPFGVTAATFFAWAGDRLPAFDPTREAPDPPDRATDAASVAAVWRELREETGWSPRPSEAARIQYLGRLWTPPHERYRFDCRFFALEVPADIRLGWQATEADAARWVTPREMLAGDGALALPTRCLLERLCLEDVSVADWVWNTRQPGV